MRFLGADSTQLSCNRLLRFGASFLQAAANTLNRQIVVVEASNKANPVHIITPRDFAKCSNQQARLFLSFAPEEHYNSLYHVQVRPIM
jgi:hypothetical protein